MFKFKPNKPANRSGAWAQKLIDDDKYTYHDCIEYPKVMAHHIRSQMRTGDSKGYPIIDAEKGHVPPDGSQVYDATTTPVSTSDPHMTKPHAEMHFLRAAPLERSV